MADLIVHFKKPRGWQNTLKIHYWHTAPVSSSTTWSGLSMAAEGNDWFVYRFEGISAASIVFNDGAGNQTADLRRDKEGWFFNNNVWYDRNPEAPVIPVISAIPLGDTYPERLIVTLSSSNSDDAIYYTIDGSEPTTDSIRYTQPITIEKTTTLLALGVNSQGETGSISSFVYTIDPNADFKPATITPSQDSGSYSEPLSVSFTIRDNHPEPLVAYYSTDRSEPTTTSQIYAQGNALNGLTGSELAIERTSTVRFLVIDGAGNETRESFDYRLESVTPVTDFREETIYFLITTRFCDGDPSNNFFCRDRIKFNATTGEAEDPHWRGDFRGLIQQLDYIKDLGFTAIWITPPIENRSGLDYHGYHGYDWTKIDPRLESEDATYQDLIDQAHARGLKIIQDVVVNHSCQYGIRGKVWIDHLPIKYYVPPGSEQGRLDNGPYQGNL
ncbi:MAG: chitobiase/beta-hexosaminidase C-terminal domain-containing protein, partial [Xenococcaceae cyanobacterium MO_167.B52]|nr:chitobiase/beta-hexosaminidase C-terminal domain-containing protein [Xenococcaceae cyanobacterium MO_167.B52]